MKRWRRGFPDGAESLVFPQAYYERMYAEDWHKKTGTYRPWNKQTGKHLWYAAMCLAKGRILDVGCGAGQLARMLKDFGRAGDYVTGIDYCPSAIQIATDRAPTAHFARAHAETHPELLARNHYDVAVLLEVLEHIFDDVGLLAKIPAGRRVVASVPSFPTDGHCRWFANQDQVRERYRPLVEFYRVIVEAGIESDNRWFVFLGRRR